MRGQVRSLDQNVIWLTSFSKSKQYTVLTKCNRSFNHTECRVVLIQDTRGLIICAEASYFNCCCFLFLPVYLRVLKHAQIVSFPICKHPVIRLQRRYRMLTDGWTVQVAGKLYADASQAMGLETTDELGHVITLYGEMC